jgi:hypothetical protein
MCDSTYVVRLWTPVEVDIVEEKLRVVVLVMLYLVMLLLKVREKVARAGGVTDVRLRTAELAKSRGNVRAADILGTAGLDIYMADIE